VDARPDRSAERLAMVERDLVRRGVRDPRVLDAFRSLPRERFVARGSEASAYEDTPLAIGGGQTISQPYMVARMLEVAAIGRDDRVLDVGTGSGYAAALAGLLAREVESIERLPELAREAAARLSALGLAHVRVHVGDGSLGLAARAPYDAILVAAAAPRPPEALKRQLKVGGRLVLPVGERAGDQCLVRVTRTSPTTWREEPLGGVRFVPLVGREGW
jgi:protein-L-isoaspartate(D-aspartate) O-methyltransferase